MIYILYVKSLSGLQKWFRMTCKLQVQVCFKGTHILCVSSVGPPIYLHPTNCSQVRSASAAVWCSATGGRLPAARTSTGFGMSWTRIVFMLLDYDTTVSLPHGLPLRGYSGSPPFCATLHVCSLRGTHFTKTTKPQRGCDSEPCNRNISLLGSWKRWAAFCVWNNRCSWQKVFYFGFLKKINSSSLHLDD